MSMSAGEMFPDLPIPERTVEAAAPRAPRVLMPNRIQVELRASDLESLLSEEHTARLVWGFVERQDLSALYASIKAVDGGPGRDAIAPEILLSLWLYATLEGVGSARALSRLCEAHDAYRWLCGGVRVDHHTLSDFRVDQGAFLDTLLTQSVVSLMSRGAVTLKRVAQDGMRVRASAGAASFRRKGRLQELQAQAHEQVERLKREVAEDPAATDTSSQVVVGVDVTARGSDYGEMPVMLDPLARRYDTVPEEIRVDGGFSKLTDVEQAAEKGTTVFGPVPQPKDPNRDLHLPLPDDSEVAATCRRRMGTDEAKTIYKERAATAECVNAAARNRGLQRFVVRGHDKTLSIALLFAIAHNLARLFALSAPTMT